MPVCKDLMAALQRSMATDSQSRSLLITEERLSEIEILLGGAPPGPWYVDCTREWGDPVSWHIPDVVRWNGPNMANCLHFDGDEALARFVAACPEIVAELLAEVRRLQGRP